MKLPAYPRTKPSGVEWLGDVPEHWGVSCLKHSVNELYSGGTPESGNSEYWANDDEESIAWVSIGDMTRAAFVKGTEKRITRAGLASKRLRILPTGTLLYSMYASLGKVAVLGIPATVNQAILGIVPDSKKSEQSFLRYWLIKMESHLELFSSSNTQDNLNAGKVRALPLVVPPPPEQRAIAAFLDLETGRVDRLVAKKRELIERLKEKRTALISRTVTRGLPPAAARVAGLPENPPLKPSVLDWLGDIPAQWAVKQLKHLGSIVSGCAFDSGDFTSSGVRVLKIANIQTLRLDWSDESFLPEEFYGEYPAFVVRDGDVVFALTRPIISTGLKAAIAAIGDERILLNQRNALFRPRPEVNRHFFYHALFCVSFKAVFETQIDFTGQQPNISPIDIGNIKIPVPPLPEQAAIAAYLDKETAKLDALVGKVEEAVERLQEYRTALITAAVTGKIDVRPPRRDSKKV